MKFAQPLAALFLLLSLFSGSPAYAQSEANCSVLYAGQTTEVGSVCVTVNADDVFLDYLLVGGWKLSEAHAWIGDSLASLPVNSGGNPQIGLFPHSATNLGSVAQHSFTIPISELAVNADTFCNAEVFVAAHAVVTRTIAGGGNTGGGTGGHSGGGKSDKSDKSGKSDHSGKSGKSGQSGKSDKSGQSGKSDKSGYGKSDKNSKGGSASSAKSNGKGKTYNATSAGSSSEAKSSSSPASNSKGSSSQASNNNNGKGNSSHASNNGKGKSDKSGKSGHSGKSDKSGKSGKSGDHNHNGHHHGSNQPCNEGGGSSGGGHSGGGSSGGGTTQPSTQTESAWAGTMQINNGGSWARYFSFTNDFCEDPEEPPVLTLPQGCFNVFAVGQTAFTPVGVLGSVTGWVNTFTAADTGFGTVLSDGTNDYGTIIGYLPGNGTLELYYSLTNSSLVFHSANAYAGAPGSFTNMSPLQYGNSAAGSGAPFLVLNLAAQQSPQLEVVAHAAVCPAGVIN